MKIPFLTLLFFGVIFPAAAQVSPDSLQQKLATAADKLSLDSIPRPFALENQKIDSIRTGFNLTADSLRSEYQEAVAGIDRGVNRLNNRIDSLRHLSVPAGPHQQKLDSLQALRRNVESKFTSRLEALKAKTTGKLNVLDLPPEYKEPLLQLTGKVDALNLRTGELSIPELKTLNLPGYTLPSGNGLGDLAAQAGAIGNAGNIGNLPEITPGGDPGQLSQQAAGYQEDIKNIAGGNLSDVQALPETIEAQASKVDDIGELQKQSAVLDEYKRKAAMLKDAESAKQKAVELARDAAVDHFAGRQEQLKAAMEKIARYKQKYSSVSSIKDLPKRPPNPMKGKPFVERLVPGLYFQYQRKDQYLIDVNPYVGYKLSGRFTSGLGWNQRYAYDDRQHGWDTRSRIYGPRTYVDFRLGKGFIAHVEGEYMNTFVPSTLRGTPDTGQREWVFSLMTGMKKEYRIYKNLKGTALVQYNLFNRDFKAPYVDRLNSRIGFEYVLKKKKMVKEK